MLKNKDHSKQNIIAYIVDSVDVEEETEVRFEGVEVYGIQRQTLCRFICGYTAAYKININTYQSEKKTDFIE